MLFKAFKGILTYGTHSIGCLVAGDSITSRCLGGTSIIFLCYGIPKSTRPPKNILRPLFVAHNSDILGSLCMIIGSDRVNIQRNCSYSVNLCLDRIEFQLYKVNTLSYPRFFDGCDFLLIPNTRPLASRCTRYPKIQWSFNNEQNKFPHSFANNMHKFIIERLTPCYVMPFSMLFARKTPRNNRNIHRENLTMYFLDFNI